MQPHCHHGHALFHNMFLILIHIYLFGCSGNPDAKRLYDDLLSNYNKLVRPVSNVTEVVTVQLKLKLSQLIAVVRRRAEYFFNSFR